MELYSPDVGPPSRFFPFAPTRIDKKRADEVVKDRLSLAGLCVREGHHIEGLLHQCGAIYAAALSRPIDHDKLAELIKGLAAIHESYPYR